ncbi:hypothetical protein FRC19_001673 [Serendipita sp. 401]|nr:hypothetical protein FRC19_001673 [Serendipita sp. 401]
MKHNAEKWDVACARVFRQGAPLPKKKKEQRVEGTFSPPLPSCVLSLSSSPRLPSSLSLQNPSPVLSKPSRELVPLPVRSSPNALNRGYSLSHSMMARISIPRPS